MNQEYDLFGFEDENNNNAAKVSNVKPSGVIIDLPSKIVFAKDEEKVVLEEKIEEVTANGSDDEFDDDDDDDQIVVKCGDLNALMNAPQQTAVVEDEVVKEQPSNLPEQSELEVKIEHDLCSIREEDKPWKKVGSDISDYFNFGFNELDWLNYCEKQRRMRMENAQAIAPPAFQNQEKVMKKHQNIHPTIPGLLPQQLAALGMLPPAQMFNAPQYYAAIQNLMAMQARGLNQPHQAQNFQNYTPESSRHPQNESERNYSRDGSEVPRSPRKSRYHDRDYRSDDEEQFDAPDRNRGRDDHRRHPELKQRDNRYENDSRPSERQDDRKPRDKQRDYRHERPNFDDRPNRRNDFDDNRIEDNGRREDKFRKPQKNEDQRQKMPARNEERRTNNEAREPQRPRKRSRERSPSLQRNYKRRA